MNTAISNRASNHREGPRPAASWWEIAFHFQISIPLVAGAGGAFFLAAVFGVGQQLLPQPWLVVIGIIALAAYGYLAVLIVRRALWLCGMGPSCEAIIAPPSRINCVASALFSIVLIGIAFEQMGQNLVGKWMIVLLAIFILSMSTCGYFWKRSAIAAS
jgi:hypothetical protein